MALVGVVLALFLAGALDFGRAFYTAAIVTNMAGEGASYAALYPYLDYDDQACSMQPVDLTMSIQERARNVAREHGLAIEAEDQRSAVIIVSVDSDTSCRLRCVGATVTVKITYRINDLFLPALLGQHNIPITRSASQLIRGTLQRNNDSCQD